MVDLKPYYSCFDDSALYKEIDRNQTKLLEECNSYYSLVEKTYCIDNFDSIIAEINANFDNLCFDVYYLEPQLNKLEQLYDSLRKLEIHIKRNHLSGKYQGIINRYYSILTLETIGDIATEVDLLHTKILTTMEAQNKRNKIIFSIFCGVILLLLCLLLCFF